MPKFSLITVVEIRAQLDIEADSEKDALDLVHDSHYSEKFADTIIDLASEGMWQEKAIELWENGKLVYKGDIKD